MRSFEYVKILNELEVSNYISSFTNKQNSKSLVSQKYLELNKELLFQEYEIYETEIIRKYEDDLKDFNTSVDLWNEKKCECGSSLNYISAFSFWGCPNYRDKVKKHTPFSEDQDDIFARQFQNIKVRLSHNWSSEILNRTNLKQKIKAKELLTFYIEEGFEDLREKYGYNNSIESISSFIYAKQKSKRRRRC